MALGAAVLLGGVPLGWPQRGPDRDRKIIAAFRCCGERGRQVIILCIRSSTPKGLKMHVLDDYVFLINERIVETKNRALEIVGTSTLGSISSGHLAGFSIARQNPKNPKDWIIVGGQAHPNLVFPFYVPPNHRVEFSSYSGYGVCRWIHAEPRVPRSDLVTLEKKFAAQLKAVQTEHTQRLDAILVALKKASLVALREASLQLLEDAVTRRVIEDLPKQLSELIEAQVEEVFARTRDNA